MRAAIVRRSRKKASTQYHRPNAVGKAPMAIVDHFAPKGASEVSLGKADGRWPGARIRAAGQIAPPSWPGRAPGARGVEPERDPNKGYARQMTVYYVSLRKILRDYQAFPYPYKSAGYRLPSPKPPPEGEPQPRWVLPRASWTAGRSTVKQRTLRWTRAAEHEPQLRLRDHRKESHAFVLQGLVGTPTPRTNYLQNCSLKIHGL